jgi:hypothetical protein
MDTLRARAGPSTVWRSYPPTQLAWRPIFGVANWPHTDGRLANAQRKLRAILVRRQGAPTRAQRCRRAYDPTTSTLATDGVNVSLDCGVALDRVARVGPETTLAN